MSEYAIHFNEITFSNDNYGTISSGYVKKAVFKQLVNKYYKAYLPYHYYCKLVVSLLLTTVECGENYYVI